MRLSLFDNSIHILPKHGFTSCFFFLLQVAYCGLPMSGDLGLDLIAISLLGSLDALDLNYGAGLWSFFFFFQLLISLTMQISLRITMCTVSG